MRLTVCFSETASFVAGTALCGGGLVALKLVQRPAEIPLATLPLIFGFQQLTEGLVWRALNDGGSTNAPVVQIYLFCALILWPSFVPLVAYCLESVRWRRRVIAACGVLGLEVSLFLGYILIGHGATAFAEDHRVIYKLEPLGAIFSVGPYIVAATIPLLISSVRSLNMFGVLALAGVVASYLIYKNAFVSVWCFQAAIMSAVIVAHFVRESRRTVIPAADLTPAPAGSRD